MARTNCKIVGLRITVGNILPIVLFALFAVGSITGPTAAGASATEYSRADADEIRSNAREILSSDRFEQVEASEKEKKPSLLDRFLMWVIEKIGSLLGRGIAAMSGLHLLGKVLMIGLIVLFTLLVGYIIWSIAKNFRPRGGSIWKGGVPHFKDVRGKTYDEICKLMRQLYDEGKFREAIGMMMLAMIRWLEKKDLVQIDESKTNGDYVREYPPLAPGSIEFKGFARQFDRVIYAGIICQNDDYNQMNNIFEKIQEDVSKR